MTRDEAMNLTLGQKVYVVNKLNQIEEKVVVGASLKLGGAVSITYADSVKKCGNGYVLDSGFVHFEKNEALAIVKNELEIQKSRIQDKIDAVTREMS